MPSPIGHALAGIVVAWTADLVPGDRAWRDAPCSPSWLGRAGGGVTLLCAGLAAAPDLDLALPYAHRTFTHSIGAVVFVAVVAAALTARAGRPVARLTLMCAVAYASHLLLDWLGVDRYPPLGIMALWPISHAWYISGLDVFRQTARLRVFTRAAMLVNAKAIAQELAILAPVAFALWLVRVKALAGLAPQVARRDHPPQ
jgi:inner membrane protein